MASSRNIYKREIDFRALALESPEFAKRLKTNDQLDFTDPESVRQLTKSLLARDFELAVDLPDDRLCPPVPNRLNYILWLQDLLDTSSRTGDDQYDPNRQVLGLDMVLLQSDIDDRNISSSRQTVSKNKLENRVKIIETKPDDPLIPFEKLNVDRLDFVMCNPPFYESEEELTSSAAAKSRPPFTACTGSAVEMITPGGEVAFVSAIVMQSVDLKTRVLWFTSMLGKLSSVSVIVQKLLDIGIKNWAVTEFVQGKGTRRWAVGWSFSDWRPRSDASRGITTLSKNLLPFPSHYSFDVSIKPNDLLKQAIANINTDFSSLRHFCYSWISKQSCIGYAKEDVWSRKARRKFAREQGGKEQGQQSDKMQCSNDGKSKQMEEMIENAALGFRIDLSLQADGSVHVVIRWLKGLDQVLFESFCGMVKRKIMEEIRA
ncbi:hypothetical protein UA08_03054 [Talaromyces atroroseus]|uniref:U6 small nuclear RNA (adenine-(43)-N(6))-methyltransferase n=1 Tax=Talaromyces atroroseus TaxID=1441469 RepID=A0A225AN99_TALAT|nr:hypothetical protein UA08_03054 [Talaromyces atroroseus]OKL62360.1 hypothetical protein UA08_03054 [Talaromyces atroroseus]